MQLRAGFELIYCFPPPTPIILVVNIHDSRASDIVVPDHLTTEPFIPVTCYRDGFGNRCNRVLAPAGRLLLTTDCVIRDSGQPDEMVFAAGQDPVQDLPEENLVFLLGSRYCETDWLSRTAWQVFSHMAPGYPRVQAICDYVYNHIAFNYQNARATRSAAEAFNERTGVCRDYAHLAIAFCRCMNIPARYCTGYLSDVGTLPPYGVGDFAAWFEAWIGGRWHTFDSRNNVPRIGRILMARAAMRPMWRSPPRSDPICWRASGSGPLRFQTARLLKRPLERRADVLSYSAPLHRLPLQRAGRPGRTPHDPEVDYSIPFHALRRGCRTSRWNSARTK